MFAGVWTAIATPMHQGAIDFAGLEKLVELQVFGGVRGIIPCGTTGESPTLSTDEKLKLTAECVRLAKGRIKVCAGVGGSSTADAVAYSKAVVATGADAVMCVVPPYNKPPQRGLIAHFQSVADAIAPLPLMLYNVPGRTACNMLPATVGEIARRCKNVGGVKEASGDLGALSKCVALFGPGAEPTAKGNAAANDRGPLEVLAGDDGLFLPSLALGAVGLVSVASNVEPRLVVSIFQAWNEGRNTDAAKAMRKLSMMVDTLFCDTSPIPVKHWLAAAHQIGDGSVRLPLVEADQRVIDSVAAARRALAEW